jgi:peptidoglycan/xylan/chitin deacetylase (PgdA/CDA1 family)
LIIPVLLYHSVGDDQSRGHSWGAVSPEQFRAHVELIAATGRKSVTISTLVAMLRGEQPLVDRPVAVTFDDGYADTYHAVHWLRSRGLRATVYVTTGGIGGTRWLCSKHIAELAALGGVEIGAHAVRHRRLDELDDPELAYEVRASKRLLERVTSRGVMSFSYPHGAYDRRVREAVIEAGYQSATTVKNALSHPGDDPFAIARFTVTGATSTARIGEVLEGERVPLAWTGERLRTRAYRVVRRTRRRLGTVGRQTS